MSLAMLPSYGCCDVCAMVHVPKRFWKMVPDNTEMREKWRAMLEEITGSPVRLKKGGRVCDEYFLELDDDFPMSTKGDGSKPNDSRSPKQYSLMKSRRKNLRARKPAEKFDPSFADSYSKALNDSVNSSKPQTARKVAASAVSVKMESGSSSSNRPKSKSETQMKVKKEQPKPVRRATPTKRVDKPLKAKKAKTPTPTARKPGKPAARKRKRILPDEEDDEYSPDIAEEEEEEEEEAVWEGFERRLENETGKRNVVLCTCGSVASVKVPELVKSLSRHANVVLVCTEHSRKFFSPDDLPEGTPVIPDDHFLNEEDSEPNFVKLYNWAEACVIAPMTANTLGLLASGFCDTMMTSLARIWNFSQKPFLVAPAMNTMMLENEITKKHLEVLKERSIQVIPSAEKQLACGDYGNGALARVNDIVTAVMASIGRKAAELGLEPPAKRPKKTVPVASAPENGSSQSSVATPDREKKAAVLTPISRTRYALLDEVEAKNKANEWAKGRVVGVGLELMKQAVKQVVFIRVEFRDSKMQPVWHRYEESVTLISKNHTEFTSEQQEVFVGDKILTPHGTDECCSAVVTGIRLLPAGKRVIRVRKFNGDVQWASIDDVIFNKLPELENLRMKTVVFVRKEVDGTKSEDLFEKGEIICTTPEGVMVLLSSQMEGTAPETYLLADVVSSLPRAMA
eukprot:CAMPEP_0119127280 /NCGR_PEP_ID=MMETSP1310-20130426/5889_1 /TAXON_ID=464262 /ORGANISM="Genus nov. species nov., Strain RCC2339" /LENGTH=682 /DNA_ID=CAMNT_0007117525 /DNA_START=212 /DNA_END=2260 /DNA_ORIENTATION=+